MNHHYNPNFWHYGYENETELHVFVYGAVRHSMSGRSNNVFGIFFGYADKRNSWGETEGPASSERAQLGAVNKALALVQNDNRILYVHTTNVQVVDRLEHWIAVWTETKFQQQYDLEDSANADLIGSLAKLLEARTRDVYFESIYHAAKVPGCALAISLAQEDPRFDCSSQVITAAPARPRRSSSEYEDDASTNRSGVYCFSKRHDNDNDEVLEPREFAVAPSNIGAEFRERTAISADELGAVPRVPRRRIGFTENNSNTAALVAN